MKRFLFTSVFSLLAMALPGSATLLTLSGNVGIIAHPPSLLPGALYSQQYIFLILEQQQIVLGAPLAVDFTAPGTYNMLSQLVPGTIPAGTLVNSYYLHADPINHKVLFSNQFMSFSSDELIIGVMVNSPTLASGVPQVGLATTTYNGPTANNGFRFNAVPVNFIQISADQHTVTFTEQLKQTALMEFRVITTTVPVITP